MNRSEKRIYPFNNKIEAGLRILSILNAAYPASYDLQSLVYLDYLTVHSGDVENGITSLHPPTPSRKGELFVRRALIHEAIDVFISKGLMSQAYTDDGVEYKATDESTPFIDSLTEQYSTELNIKAAWVIEKFSHLNKNQLQVHMQEFAKRLDFEFTLTFED